MLRKIYEKIKEYNVIVIARHIGVDPDALGSQFALKLAIEKTFPNKKVYAIGSKSVRYNYFPKMDKLEPFNEKVLLIVTDTPDIKRIDIENFSSYPDVIKIDHHPFVDKLSENLTGNAGNCSAIVLWIRIIVSIPHSPTHLISPDCSRTFKNVDGACTPFVG